MKVITRGVERPILFSGPMVRAIIEGRKTQTRRLIKPQPIQDEAGGWKYGKNHKNYAMGNASPATDELFPYECPYGQPGDLLWVRETWAMVPALPPQDFGYIYKADFDDDPFNWRPSIHMPRAAARLLLEITYTRAEPLLAITEADAIAEGVETWPDGNYKAYGKHAGKHSTARGSYLDLWDSINPHHPANTNPVVWVIQFAKI